MIWIWIWTPVVKELNSAHLVLVYYNTTGYSQVEELRNKDYFSLNWVLYNSLTELGTVLQVQLQ